MAAHQERGATLLMIPPPAVYSRKIRLARAALLEMLRRRSAHRPVVGEVNGHFL
jgi:hypothetical protein